MNSIILSNFLDVSVQKNCALKGCGYLSFDSASIRKVGSS